MKNIVPTAIFKNAVGTLCDLFFAEVVFTYSAKGTYEVLGKVLKLGACGNAIVGIAYGFVINPTAHVTYILFHFNYLL